MTINEKKESARQCVLRQMTLLSLSNDIMMLNPDFRKIRGEIINDAANSVADNYEEYMTVWEFLNGQF